MKKRIISLAIILIILSSSFLIKEAFAQSTQPTKLKIYIGPTSVPADNNPYNCVYVQLHDSRNRPARALQETTISLSSSNTDVGTVDTKIVIPVGATYATANFYSSFTPGKTTIAATASGYTTVQGTITTVGPIPSAIAVFGFPSTLPADGGAYDSIMVQLQDSSGSPAKAPKGGIQVALSCADTNIGTITPSVTINEGQTYAIATFTTTQTTGSATITPVASGYTSKSGNIKTQQIATDTTTSTTLQIYTGPTKLLADKAAYKQIAIQLESSKGLISAPADIIITIGSSDQNIGLTENQITIPKDKTYALATFTTTFKAGSTTIIAAATDYTSNQKTITTIGLIPTKLAVFGVPSLLAADNSEYQIIQVQLQDAQGRPAKDPEGNVILNLFSSEPSVGDVSSTLTIPFGKTHATGIFKTTNIAGSTSVTAQASSYTTGQTKITTYQVSGPTQTNGSATIELCIKNINGNALNETLVISSIQPAGMKTLSAITNATGYVTFKDLLTGTYTFTITKEGYEPVNQTITFKGQPISLTLTLQENAKTNLTLIIILSIVATAISIAAISGVLLIKRRKASRFKALQELQKKLKPKYQS
jgi:hypothetical protein